MSVVLLRTVNNVDVGILNLDATISHNITANAQVTEHPVEDGSTITDNFRDDPIDITVTGLVTNHPTRVGLGLPAARDDSRSQTAQDTLYEIRNNRELITLVDELKTYRNMAMTGLDMPRDRTTRNALRFTARFKQVELVGAQVAQLEDTDQVKDVATPTSDLGKQTANTSEDEDADSASLLYQGFEAINFTRFF
jgi:hypothetical protein